MRTGKEVIEKNVKRIVVPLQPDQNSERLLQYSGAMAGLLGAELLLLHCTQHQELTFTQQNQGIRLLRTFGERILCRQYDQNGNFISFDCVVRPGTLRQTIKSIVQDYQADLVIMEAPEPGQEDNTATGVMEEIGCPVMIMPQASFPIRLSNLLFVTDFTDANEKVLKQIAGFAQQAGAGLTMVQVYTPAQRNTRCALKAAMQQVQQMLKEYTIDFYLHEEDDLIEGISEVASRMEADMLLLATQDSHLMQKLFAVTYLKTLAYHTQIPITVFKQIKAKPCSGCCGNCKSKQAATTDEIPFTIAIV